MRDALTFLAVIVVIVVSLTALLWWPVYKYKDCRRVGHTPLYCVVDQL